MARPFDVEQEGARRGGRNSEAPHEQGRAQNAAKEHDRRKPGQVACAQRRLGAPEAERTASGCDQGEAGAGAEIQQPRQQQRIGDAEEQLCNRCAHAKQECRAERQQRSAAKLMIIGPIVHCKDALGVPAILDHRVRLSNNRATNPGTPVGRWCNVKAVMREAIFH